jgi:beta-galactosidase
VKLASARPTLNGAGSAVVEKPSSQTGRFVTNFNYTGPTQGAAVQRDAQNGKPAYSDADMKFESLPAELEGADWLQLPNADKRYSAEDLIEIAVKNGSRVCVAHDVRLPVPAWLAVAGFKPTEQPLTIGGQAMRMFERRVERDESLTLSTNTEDTKSACNMYIVFVAGAN